MLATVRTRLRADSKLTPEVEWAINEFEQRCLAKIQSSGLRLAVIDFLEHEAPLEFFTAPASSSGKNHPAWQSLPGGILLNTIDCCIAIDRKLRIYPELVDAHNESLPEPHDIVYVATILTDTFKPRDFGKPWDQWQHHTLAADAWAQFAQHRNIEPRIGNQITSAIRWHLGRFTPGWPAEKNPRDLPLLDFIVHELDMDLSNRQLNDVFTRRLGTIKDPNGADDFLETEFSASSSYFQHVEGKLTNLLVFFATLLIAVVSGSYYLGSSDMFKVLTFSRTPRAFLIGLLLLVFGLISLVFIGVYVELRVRKIRMLEQMAAIRQYYADAGERAGTSIRGALRMVTSIPKCPAYLRRPSEDWYTLLLMMISSSTAIAVAGAFWTFWIANLHRQEWIKFHPLVWLAEGVAIFLIVARLEFGWTTRFCFQEDLRREKEFSKTEYHFFTKHGSSFPWPLGYLDRLATTIEANLRATIAEQRLSAKK